MNQPNQPNPTRYDAPAVFGPSLMPDSSACENCENWTISFETTRDAAAKLLPRFFELDERAFVSVHRITYRGVNYLAGGEYRELAISVDAVYNGPKETIKAAFTLPGRPPSIRSTTAQSMAAGPSVIMRNSRLGGYFERFRKSIAVANAPPGCSCQGFGSP